MVPKRTKVFICKVSFICASLSRVLGIRTHCKTSYSRIAQRKNAILTKPCLSKRFIRRGLGLIPTAVPVASQGAFHREGNKGDPNFSGFTFTPVLGHVSSVEDRQRFFERKPYQPTAEIALVIKSREMARGPEQTIFYSNSCSVRISKHAICVKIQQPVISRRPNVKRNPFVP